jgi:lipoprotein NlpI
MPQRVRPSATRSWPAIAAIAACALLAAAPAHALTQRDIDRCDPSTPPDDAIAACAAVIKSGRWSGKDLARAYSIRGGVYRRRGDYDRAIVDLTDAIKAEPNKAASIINRGSAYRAKGDLDRAIADFDDAVAFCRRGQCDPQTHAAAYGNRGNAWRDKGDNGRALADYTEAIRVDPKNALLYENRGRAQLYAGSLPQALADFTEASEVNPKRGYAALWLDIAAKRSNLPSGLADAIRQVDMTQWPGPIIRLYLGQMTPEAVLAATDNRDAVIKRGRVCEANFYTGELALLSGAKDEALRLFRLAAADCPRHYSEWWTATAELKALGSKP